MVLYIISKSNDSSRGITDIEYNHQGQPTRIEFDNGLYETYVYDAMGQLVEITQPRRLGQTRSVRTYEGCRVFVNGGLLYSYFPGGYFDADGAPHYMHTDYQGSVVMVTDSAGRIEQHISYYPYGEPHRTPEGQPMLYCGKERLSPTGDYDYGARRHHAPAINLPAPDPLSHAFCNLSPYSFCAGNPIRNVDSNGMYWKDTDKQNAMIDEITKVINDIKNIMENQNITADQAADLEERINLLTKSKDDINRLAEDKDNAYSIQEVDGDGAHHVRQGEGNNVLIEASSTALAVHEIHHVGQSLENGGLSFSSEGGLRPAVTQGLTVTKFNEAVAEKEVEAYKHQHAFDPQSMPVFIDNINSVDVHYVGDIMIDGKPAYPNVKQHSTTLKVIEHGKKR